MAIKYYEKYPQRWESPSQDYPQGAFKNLSALGEQDGSYLEEAWLNDQSGFFGALLRNAEMTPNGLVDTAQQSQFYEALLVCARKAVDLSEYYTKTQVDSEIQDNKTVVTNELGQSIEKVINQKKVSESFLNNVFNANFYGYIGDGLYHPLSERFNTLSEAKAEYDFAISLDQSIDWASIQKCLNINKICYFQGTGVITDTIVVPSGASLLGTGCAEWTIGFAQLIKDGGSQLQFYGLGSKSYELDHVSDMQVSGGVLLNESYNESTYPNTPSAQYSLTNFTNNDANGTVKATLKKFSVGVYCLGTVKLNSFRIVPYNNGISNYQNQSSLSMGAEWDVGLWMDNTNKSSVIDVQVVGYWRIAGVLKTNVCKGITSSDSAEQDNFINVTMQGMSSLCARSYDKYNVENVTPTTISIRYSKSHRFDSSGSIRVGGRIYNYTSLSYENDRLIFNVTSSAGVTVNSDLRVNWGNPWGTSGTVFNKCYFGGLYHHSRMMSSNTFLGNNKVSNAIEASGEPMRALQFVNCTAVTLEDVVMFLHDCGDFRFTDTYFEGQYARSEPEGALDSIPRGTRLIATRKATSNPKIGGDTKRLRFTGCTQNYVDMLPLYQRYDCPRYLSNDTGLFEPRDAYNDAITQPTSGNAQQEEIYYTSKNTLFKRNEATVLYSHDVTGVNRIDFLYAFPTVFHGSTIRHVFGNTAKVEWFFIDANMFRPAANGTKDLGSPVARFKDLYLVNHPTVDSDARIKNSVADINTKYLEVISKLKFKQYLLNEHSDKLHFGIIAQDWIEACNSVGLNPFESSVLSGSEKSGYSIRYGELQNLFNAYILSKLK